MIFVQTPATVLRPSVLKTRRMPRKTLWYGFAAGPRALFASKVFWRLAFDQTVLRYGMVLLPIPVVAILRPELALPLAQAPLLMFGLVYFVEVRVFSVTSPERRRAVIDETEAARGLDLLGLRARAILSRIAAGRDLRDGRLHLVVEQSELARVTPLTFLSVQLEGAAVPYLALDEEERQLLETGLFDDELSEERLLRINIRENDFLRSTVLEAGSVSAHARLAAMMARPGGSAAAQGAAGEA